jgi:methylated-DNA-[protein]-cysteine S-methyltransferase
MIYDYLESPIGQLLLAADDSGLRYIGFELGRHPVWVGDDWRRDRAALTGPRAQLDAYFAGELTQFDLPLAAQGSEFDLRVWAELRRIAYGATMSYGELARRVGDPLAARAVGAGERTQSVADCRALPSRHRSEWQPLPVSAAAWRRRSSLLEHEPAPRQVRAHALAR